MNTKMTDFKPQPQASDADADQDLPPVVEDSDGMEDTNDPATPFEAPADESAEQQDEQPSYDRDEDPRMKIAKKARERRASEMEPELEEEPGVPSGVYGQPEGDFPRIEEEGGEAEPEAAPEPTQEPQDPQADPQYFELNVNGRKMRLTEEELVAEAQKNLAAGDKLEVAKALTQELAAARAAPVTENQRQEPAEPPQDTGEAVEEENQLDDDELLEMVDTLQTGTPEEAAKVIRTLLKPPAQAAQPPAEPVDLDAKIDTRLAERKARDDQQTFLQGWASNNGDIVNDKELSVLVVNRVSDTLAQDLIGLGYPEADINQLRAQSPEELGRFHRQLRNSPQFQGRLKDPVKVMDAAADGVRQRFNMPKPQRDVLPKQEQQDPPPAQQESRQDRKRALPQQPRSASVATAPAVAQAQQPKSRKDVVADMRRARGQKA